MILVPQKTLTEQDLRRTMTPILNKYAADLVPSIKQAAALLLPQLEVLYGGSGGSGKSVFLWLAAIQYIEVPGYAALILRKVSSTLKKPGGLIAKSKVWLAPWIASGEVHWNARDLTYTFPSGATITFGHLQSHDDRYKYSSTEFQYIAFEELTEFGDETAYEFLFTRLRRPKDDSELSRIPLRIRSTTNPVGPGYQWVKDRFVGDKEDRVKTTKKRAFLEAKISDNPYLDEQEYRTSMGVLAGTVIGEKMIEGSWDAMEEGQFFNTKMIRTATPPRYFVKEVRMWDIAASEPSDSYPDPDWTCGTRLGKDALNRWWILDVEMFRVGPGELEERILEVSERDGKGIHHAMFQDPGGAGKIVVRNYVAMLPGYSVERFAIGGDKPTLALGISSQCLAGNLFVSPTVVASQEWKIFCQQLKGFPFAKHDDAVDSLSGGFNFLLEKLGKIKKKDFLGPTIR